jgi:hypothetical protein
MTNTLDKIINIPQAYFKTREFEKSGKLYEALGVRYFKKIVPTGGDYFMSIVRKGFKNAKMIDGKTFIPWYNNMTKFYESMHLVGFFAMGSIDYEHLINGRYKQAAMGVSINLAVNLYPIMLQRYNRARMAPMIEKLDNAKPRIRNIIAEELI